MVSRFLLGRFCCGNFILPSGCAHVRYFSGRFLNLRNLFYLTAAGKDHDSLAGSYPGLRDGVIRLAHELGEVRERLLNNKGW